jgi:hypothetical protein
MKYYAQFGEDKFLEKILPKYGWFVDVGAWNGRHLSNTYIFAASGWDGVEIEADLNRVEQMKKYLPDRIYRICEKVKRDNLDTLLSMVPELPKDFELLSIDIDSYDYWVWKNLKDYKPKYVVIEVGSATTPKDITKLGDDKGYTLIWDKANFIFKRNDLEN